MLWVVVIPVISAASLLMLVRRRKKKNFIASFAGKHVLITGGSKGIGLSISKKLLQEGAFVTLVSRSGSNLEEAKTSLVKELHCGSDQILTKVRKTNISLPPFPPRLELLRFVMFRKLCSSS
jgi:FlaA1/EpsC-like NDP-sugar epimerase